MYCPKDMKPCIDDLCRGSGCMAMNNAPLYEKCGGCGELVSDDDTYNCRCDDDGDASWILNQDMGAQ